MSGQDLRWKVTVYWSSFCRLTITPGSLLTWRKARPFSSIEARIAGYRWSDKSAFADFLRQSLVVRPENRPAIPLSELGRHKWLTEEGIDPESEENQPILVRISYRLQLWMSRVPALCCWRPIRENRVENAREVNEHVGLLKKTRSWFRLRFSKFQTIFWGFSVEVDWIIHKEWSV